MAREGKASITVDEETRNELRTYKSVHESWDNFLLDRVKESSDHAITTDERSGPTSDYVRCEECGRANNKLRDLDQRPCKPGIGIKER